MTSLELLDEIYRFRKSQAGTACENITRFKQAFSQAFEEQGFGEISISSEDVIQALDDKLDVRSFSVGGQKQNKHMLAASCEMRLNEGESRGRVRVMEICLEPSNSRR